MESAINVDSGEQLTVTVSTLAHPTMILGYAFKMSEMTGIYFVDLYVWFCSVPFRFAFLVNLILEEL